MGTKKPRREIKICRVCNHPNNRCSRKAHKKYEKWLREVEEKLKWAEKLAGVEAKITEVKRGDEEI